jgi:sporulation protein YqfC
MGFIDNIIEFLGGEEFYKNQSFRAVMFGDSAVYFEGVTSIISYEKEQVLLGVKKGRLTIKGKDLYIKKYCMGDVVICGKISAIERVEGY